MTNTLNIYRTQNNLERETGGAISEYIRSKLDQRVLFLVSGGSALKVLDHIDVSNWEGKVLVSLVDERSDKSNFLALSQTDFYKKINYVEFGKWPDDCHIVVLLGIGTDGHTAGIMPYPEDPKIFTKLFEGDQDIVDYDAGNKNPYPKRSTVTISFIKNKVHKAFVYVSGEGKREILETVLESREISKYPASVFHFINNVGLYSDILINS